MVKKTIKIYLCLAFLVNLSMSYMAGMYITFLRYHGLDYVGAIVPNIFYFVTILLFELPTGAIADVFGRKISFVLSCLIWALAKVVYFFADSLWLFITAEIIAAIGQTCASGAFEAWLVDSLRYHGYQGKTSAIFAQGIKTKQLATVLGALIGTWASKNNIALPWLMGAITFFVTAVAAMAFMREEYFVKKSFSFKSGWLEIVGTIQDSKNWGLNNEHIRFVLASSALLTFITQGPNMQWQPFFQGLGANRLSFGWIFATISLSLMAGSHYAPKVLAKIGDEKRSSVVALTSIGFFVALTAMAGGQFLWALPPFLAHEFCRGLFSPIKSQYLNDHARAAERATINSLESLTSHLAGAIGLIISGILAQALSPR